jgi:hypothetical protein
VWQVWRHPPQQQCGEPLDQPLLLSGAAEKRLCEPLLSPRQLERKRRLLSRWALRSSMRPAHEASSTPIPTCMAAQEALPQVCSPVEAPPLGPVQVVQAVPLQMVPGGPPVRWRVERAFRQAGPIKGCLLPLSAEFLEPGALARPRARRVVA